MTVRRYQRKTKTRVGAVSQYTFQMTIASIMCYGYSVSVTLPDQVSAFNSDGLQTLVSSIAPSTPQNPTSTVDG